MQTPSRRVLSPLLFIVTLSSVALSFALVGASVVEAQDTGGSFGGSDWGGGGGGSDWGGGGGGSDWGSSGSDWGSSGSDWGSDSSSPGVSSGGGGGGGVCVAMASIALIVILYIAVSVARRRRADLARGLTSHAGRRAHAPHLQNVDVSAISIAIDWRARRRLQARLAELARTGNTGTTAGLTALLHETVVEIRRVEHAWLYAGAVNASPGPVSAAQSRFVSVAQDMRSRFRHELVRNVSGTVRSEDAPALRPDAREGDGVVVVTVVVAARGDIPDVAHAHDAGHLRMLMRSLGAINASQLVALEVIWSPAAEDDRMSTAELEVLYPELRKIDERSVAGRVFCRYCTYPYPAELLRCPECGAPSETGPANAHGGAPVS